MIPIRETHGGTGKRGGTTWWAGSPIRDPVAGDVLFIRSYESARRKLGFVYETGHESEEARCWLT